MQVDLIRTGAKYLAELERQGLQFEVSQDFGRIPKMVEQTGRDYQLPTFCVTRNDHTRGRVFWAFLKDQRSERYIATVAALLQDIGEEPFDEYLHRLANSQYPARSGSTLAHVSTPMVEKIGGNLVYVGELQVAKSHQGRRNLVASFMRLVQILALMEWPQLDWIYAFVQHRHVKTGKDKDFGFLQRLPKAQTWHDPVPEKRASSEWWVGSPRNELLAFFEAEARSADFL